MNYEKYMEIALHLARYNLGKTSPNPSVGAVLVLNDKIISTGATQPPGKRHAELQALNCNVPEGSTLVTTLEPCSHENKLTPPCTKAIINSGVKTVVIGAKDPNPNVNGINVLRSAGINVITGVLENECKKSIEFFGKYILTRKPFITLKSAMTSDYKLTWGNKNKKQVTGKECYEYTQVLRKVHDAVLVGVNTILHDNPYLDSNYRHTTKIVLDSNLKTPPQSNIFKFGQTIIFTTSGKKMSFPQNTKIIQLPSLNFENVFSKLSEMNIISVLVEGGLTLSRSLLNENAVDKWIMYLSPQKMPQGEGFLEKLNTKLIMHDISATFLGADLMVEGYL